jgi:hypothetical protein
MEQALQELFALQERSIAQIVAIAIEEVESEVKNGNV